MILPPELWAINLYAGQMMDALTTRYALQHELGEEANPIAAWYISKFGVAKIGIPKSILAGAFFVVIGYFINNEIYWSAITLISWIPPLWNYFGVIRPEESEKK